MEHEIFGYEMRDSFGAISPEDSKLWLAMFYLAEKHFGQDLCTRLQYIRNSGSRLVPNTKYGYSIQPVISAYGWESMAQYEKEKKCLNKYKDEVVKLLGVLAKKRS